MRHEPLEIPLGGIRRLEWLTPRYIAERYRADLAAGFRMRLADLLKDYGRFIGVCAEPSCGRLFLRRKRQEYCSRGCSQRVRAATMRGKPGFPEKRHSYYVKKIEREKGAAAAEHVRRRVDKERK